MRDKDITNGNGIKLEGYIDIDIINTKDHLRKRVHNTITKAGKQLLLHKSIGQLMQSGASIFGKIACLNTMTCTGEFSGSISDIASSSGYSRSTKGRVSTSDTDVTCALLNLGAKQNGLTENSTFIPSYKADGTLDGLTGFSNNNVNTALSNEGLVDICKAEYCADPYTVCNRWKYDAGVASGTIDTIVMSPASVIKSKNGFGLRFMKCIDRVNIQDESFVSCSTGFLPPSVSGFTGSNEIMLNFDDGTGSRWKYNIDTGEVTTVPDSDNFYVMTYNKKNIYLMDWYIEDNYLYELRNTGSSWYIYVINLTDGSEVTNFYNNIYSCYFGRFLKTSSGLYVTFIRDSSYSDTVYKLGKSTYYNSWGSSVTYDELGITIPSAFNKNDVCFGMYNGKYVMEYTYEIDGSTYNGQSNNLWWKAQTYRLRSAFVFTSLNDIIGTMTDKIAMITPGALYTSKGVIQIGQCKYVNSDISYNSDVQDTNIYSIDTCGGSWFVCNNRNNYNTAVKTKNVNLDNAGCWISLDGWWSDVLSFVKLNSPIEKGDSDVMYVSYGYKVVV